MSVCYICLDEGWKKTSAGGFCVECSSYVCRTPSSRPDDWVHGRSCGCGCRQLVCEVHTIVHSQGHSGGVATLPSPCFPDLTLDVAPPAGSAAGDLLGGMAVEHAPRYAAISRLLRTVAPGGMALYNATAIKGSVFETGAEAVRIEQREPKDDFFTPARVEKILALAARMAAEVTQPGVEVGDRGRKVLTELFGKERPSLSVRLACEQLLGQWVPVGVSVPDPMTVPTEPSALARWLLQDERLTSGLESLSSASEISRAEAFLGAELP